ncbi:hypothetical protein HUJ04_011328, partial [Dendroctonus ponderosae]
MHLERMHMTIKQIYLNSKFVKRLDKGINALMKFVRDKLFERLIILHLGKLTSKLRDLTHRHKTSQSMNLNLKSKEAVPVNWFVANVMHVHRYSCTCLDSSVRWNMCKHMHLICTWQKIHATYIISTVTPLES